MTHAYHERSAAERLTPVESQIIVSLASAGVAALVGHPGGGTSAAVARAESPRQARRALPRADWAERAAVRAECKDDVIDLIAEVRAESQGQAGRGYFIIWRLI
jgi:hypothetical protein